MENTTAFDPLEYLPVLRRRVWWLIGPIVLAVIVAAALLAWLPRQYQATATIGVSLPGVSGPLLNETPKVTAEERARNISQILLSQPVLERVVREEGFDKHMAVPDAVQMVRSHVTVSVPPPDPTQPQGAPEQFYINYTGDVPKTTQKLTNRLADVFVEESSRKREVRAEETSMFISMQLEASKNRLEQLENQLRTSREAYMGALPEQTNANVALVTGLQQQLETTTNAIRGDQDRLSSIERQLDAIKSGAGTDPATGTPSLSPAAARVLAARRELAAARAVYTDKHPEVIRLQDELAKAEADMKAEAQQPESDRLATLRLDPTYRALLTEREQVRQRIADGQRRQSSIQSQIGMYRARVDAAPRVEQQMQTIGREYELEKKQYETLNGKLRDAQMAESLVRNQGGERFTVLAHASLPSSPSSPNIPRLLVMVLLVGCCLGGGLAIGREYLDRSIYDSRALNDLELPVLGEIPRIAQA
jgi:polysaccharide chain length determinant protein (PEP-CTERM system associated)